VLVSRPLGACGALVYARPRPDTITWPDPRSVRRCGPAQPAAHPDTETWRNLGSVRHLRLGSASGTPRHRPWHELGAVPGSAA
jgi:hypothetical protein